MKQKLTHEDVTLNLQLSETETGTKEQEVAQIPTIAIKQEKYSRKYIITLALLALLVAFWGYIYVMGSDMFTVTDTPVQETPLIDTTVQKADIVPPVETTATSSEVPESLKQFFLTNEQALNGLAVGFTTMATVLAKPEVIKDIREVKDEMLFTEGDYRTLFANLRSSTTDITALAIVDDYERLLNMRILQADALQESNGVAVSEMPVEDLEAINALWATVVERHAYYSEQLGVDFTGGLGNLMR